MADLMEDSVLIDRLGPVAFALTAHVGRSGVEACLGQRLDLVTPGVPTFWKAVAEQHKLSLALLSDI